ncbi:hypothetical protein HYY75_07460 [bacterium]|nr:hypothetical protein [bacterium]
METLNPAQVKFFEETPCVVLSAIKSAMKWQEWLLDSITLMVSRETPSQPFVNLVSFQSGKTLYSVSISAESISQLSQKPNFGIVSPDMGAELMVETAMVKREPLDSTGLFYQGISFFSQGDFQCAGEIFEKLFKKVPEFPRASNLRGLCLRMTNRFQEAEQAYLHEIEINPRFPDAFCNLGVLYRKTNRDTMARMMFEKSLECDQFYFNALLQFSKLLMDTEGINSKLLSSINFRLLTLNANIPAALEHLVSLSYKGGMLFSEYSDRIRAESGILGNPAILPLMKRIEIFRLNGAFLAAGHGFIHLLERAESHPSIFNFILHWVAQRLKEIQKLLPNFMKESWERTQKDLFKRWPTVIEQDISEIPSLRKKLDALNPVTFFSLVLEEIFLDGQVTKEEGELIFRLKNALRIDETTYKKLLSEAKKQSEGHNLADEARDFDPRRLCKKLVALVGRDGKIEQSERTLLKVAGESLEIPLQELEAMLSEQCP